MGWVSVRYGVGFVGLDLGPESLNPSPRVPVYPSGGFAELQRVPFLLGAGPFTGQLNSTASGQVQAAQYPSQFPPYGPGSAQVQAAQYPSQFPPYGPGSGQVQTAQYLSQFPPYGSGSGQVQTTQYPQQFPPYGPGLGPTPTTQGPPQPALPSTGQDQLQVMQCQQQLAGCHLEPNQGQRSLQSNVFQSLPRVDSTSLALEHGGLKSDLPESWRSMEADAGLAPREAGQPQFSRETPAFGGDHQGGSGSGCGSNEGPARRAGDPQHFFIGDVADTVCKTQASAPGGSRPQQALGADKDEEGPKTPRTPIIKPKIIRYDCTPGGTEIRPPAGTPPCTPPGPCSTATVCPTTPQKPRPSLVDPLPATQVPPMPQVGIQDGWPSGHRISPPPPVPPGLGSGGYGSGLSSGFGVSSMTPLGLNHGLGVPPPPPPLPVPEVLGRIEEPSRYVQALPKLEDYTPEQGAVRGLDRDYHTSHWIPHCKCVQLVGGDFEAGA